MSAGEFGRDASFLERLMARGALALYRGVTTLGLPVIRRYLDRRMANGREDRTRFAERMGIASAARPAGTVVWIHAASIGEAFSVLRLIEELLAQRPRLHVVVTTGTVSSATLLADRLPKGAIHQYVPVDRIAWVRRFLDHWRPTLAVWVESEFWPNLISDTVARGIPMLLVNARMSPGSFARWQRLRAIFAPLIGAFALCLAQDGEEAKRLRALGARAVKTTGNLKHAASPLPVDKIELDALQATLDGRPRWVAASTHDGEEAAAGTVHRALQPRHADLLTIVVPRHPARAETVASMLRANGLNVARRSLNEPITPRTSVYLADTLGELGLFYRLAPVAFVGGSLVPRGGQNVLEPARLGAAVLAGPHMENFQAIADEMTAAGAIRRVADAADLAVAVEQLLTNEAARQTLSESGQRLAATKDDVLDRVVNEIVAMLRDTKDQPAAERGDLAGA